MHAFIIMGVAGAGKTTVGQTASRALDLPFLEGDTYHPADNVAKMTAGVPLTDEDRAPWIAAICKAASALAAPSCVIACSALNDVVRNYFTENFNGEINYIHLSVSKDTLTKRMASRVGHYMPVSLLESQLAALAPPEAGYSIDAEKPLEDVCAKVIDIIKSESSADE